MLERVKAEARRKAIDDCCKALKEADPQVVTPEQDLALELALHAMEALHAAPAVPDGAAKGDGE